MDALRLTFPQVLTRRRTIHAARGLPRCSPGQTGQGRHPFRAQNDLQTRISGPKPPELT
jgi:hypothetical protein